MNPKYIIKPRTLTRTFKFENTVITKWAMSQLIKLMLSNPRDHELDFLTTFL